MTPRYSIVIPTCGRPNLLRSALRSALAQPDSDCEILVSNNGSDAETDAIVAAHADPRLRIVRTLPLLMHDHWAYALGQARGEYLLMLCDDDALRPDTLAIVDRVLARHDADVVCWRSCWHHSEDWFDESQRGRFAFGPPCTDRVWRIDPAALIDCAFEARVLHSLFIPRMMNAAVRADCLKRCEAAGTPPFRPICPDYASMLALSMHAESMLFIDAPLYVAGATPQSIGAASLRGEGAGRRFVEEVLAREPALQTLPAMLTTAGLIAQTFHQCACEFPGLDGRTLAAAHVYGEVRRELDGLARAGGAVEELLVEFEGALAGELAGVAAAIRAYIDAGTLIQSERFLRAPVDDECATGVGAFHVPVAANAPAALMEADELAAALPGWLAANARGLSELPGDLAGRCGERQPVLYGLGGNGRAAWRVLTASEHPIAGRIVAFDDWLDERATTVPRLGSAAELSPTSHFVLVTPERSESIVARLERAGFRAGADVLLLGACGRAGDEAIATALPARAWHGMPHR